MSKRLTTEEFIAKARLKHGDKYDYSKAVYKTNAERILIICPEHGEFEQIPNTHLSGGGCWLCRNQKIGDSKRKDPSAFIRQAQEVFGDLYDYSKVIYKSGHKKVEISCPKHGVFWKTPAKHLAGQGCPECAGLKVVEHRKQTSEKLLERCREAHGERYGYSLVDWSVTITTPVKIICPEHGVFEQALGVHYRGSGCPKCGSIRGGLKGRLSKEEFVRKALQVQGGKYTYVETNPDGNKLPCKIFCPSHGFFTQRPNDHLDGHGCPTCARITRGRSKAGSALMDFVRTLAPSLVQEKRIIKVENLPRWRSDGFIPEKHLHIEFNGLRWHSTRFTKDKNAHLRRQLVAGIIGERVVFIHEDEWLYRPDAVKHYLTHLLGKSKRVYARKCTLRPVEPAVAMQFYRSYHIQSCAQRPEMSYGLYLQGDLVACMSFSQKTSNRKNPYQSGHWELVRFATKYAVVGGATKLFKAFLEDKHPMSVVSFSMNHLFTGDVYEVMGFKLDKTLKPDYLYVETKTVRRLHKSNFQHSRLKARFVDYNPSETEEQNCARHNFYRIYDCGKKRWLWSRDAEN